MLRVLNWDHHSEYFETPDAERAIVRQRTINPGSLDLHAPSGPDD
jgi:hypothetical protein